jgi:MYXO-CTERM domain-containing protein
MVRRLTIVLAFAACAWPAAAAAKGGAFFNPQQLSLPSGHTARLHLWVLGNDLDGRTPSAAPPAGSVPVVFVHLRPSGRVLSFHGTPLDSKHRSLVSIRLPVPADYETWTVSVRVGAHVYRDDIDVGEVTRPPGAARAVPTAVTTPVANPPARTGGGTDSWPAVLAGLVLAGLAGLGLIRSSWQAHERRMLQRI